MNQGHGAKFTPGLTVCPLSFNIAAVEELVLPLYKGGVFRGGFGCAFKDLTCPAGPPPCHTCRQPNSCLYSYVFETPPPPDTERLRKYPSAPHPFVIEPPETEQTSFVPGDCLSFRLMLVGKALEYASYFILAFRELGKQGIGSRRGRYRIEKVEATSTNPPEIIYSASDASIRQVSHPIQFSDLIEHDEPPGGNTRPLTLQFLTPTRIKFSEELSSSPDFHILIRNLLRRASSMAYFHCGFELDLDFGGLIRLSEQVIIKHQDIKWQDWERYSTRQKASMQFGGMVGEVTYEGPWQKFLPLLRLGELIHVGKNATFGLGKFKILNGREP